jgi:methylthioribulose-1-phosphate dehydratase
MSDLANRFPALIQAQSEIVRFSHTLYARGWSPATSSNYSVRLDPQHCAITVSGRDKGALCEQDVMVVDLDNQPVSKGRPSAETGLHTSLYRFARDIGAVLHTHSVNATVLTHSLDQSSQLDFQGYEIVKAFNGYISHEECLRVPVFENNQDIAALSLEVENWLQKADKPRAYLIRGHGLYTWGESMAECFRHLEAMEYLLECELKRYACCS